MSSSEKTVLGRFVSACAMVAFAAFLLWLAVWLIQQIWVWLLIAVVLGGVIAVTVIFLRYRRDRWFR
jgi:phosphate/sulfate permease